MITSSSTFASGARARALGLCIIWFSFVVDSYSHENSDGHDSRPEQDNNVVPHIVFDDKQSGILAIDVRDERGLFSPALLGFQRQDSWEWIFAEQTILRNPRHPLQRSQRRQWRTRYPINSCGQSLVELPVGDFIVHASKGLEYEPTREAVTIKPGEQTRISVDLKRFVDMPGMGWWSGDTHVHSSRPTSESNLEIQCAAQAEDIHVASILLMGSPDGLEFPQYGYGNDSTVQSGNYWLVPGQEGPRTNELGHVIMLNTNRLFHEPDNYYDYAQIFRAARQEGALVGLAHYFEEKFFPERSGALLFPQGVVDFVELIDDTNVFRPEHYYQALNLGFRLPLTAGSDFPWGDHIGDQRTYAFVGEGRKLTPSNWYDAIRSGKTFVSQGPLIDLTVNGMPIGSVVHAGTGDTIRVSIKAIGYPRIGAPKHVWAVALGRELKRSTASNRSSEVVALDFEFSAERSLWISAVTEAHNHSVAHTSPVYLIVDGQPIKADDEQLEQATREMLERLYFLKEMDMITDPEAKRRVGESVNEAIEHYKRKPYVPVSTGE